MAWLYLIIAGLLEIVWAVGLKYCTEFKISIALIIVVVAAISSVFFLSLAMKSIPIGTSYAIWTGIGILGVNIYEIIFLEQPVSIIRLTFILLILIGVFGLKFIVK